MDIQDEYVNRILSVKEEDMVIDLVTNDGSPSSWKNVTRRMKILSEWKGGRLIIVDMPDGFELRRQQTWYDGWGTDLTLSLTDEEINRIKEVVDGWG